MTVSVLVSIDAGTLIHKGDGFRKQSIIFVHTRNELCATTARRFVPSFTSR